MSHKYYCDACTEELVWNNSGNLRINVHDGNINPAGCGPMEWLKLDLCASCAKDAVEIVKEWIGV